MALTRTEGSTNDSLTPAASIAGRWHLLAAEWHGERIPEHRVDLVFHDDPAGLRGAVLSRRDGSEMPLQAVAFDGKALRLQMGPAPGQTVVDAPFLVMETVDDHFEGGWEHPGPEQIRLKMVRAKPAPTNVASA